jgi:hypothetical protein
LGLSNPKKTNIWVLFSPQTVREVDLSAFYAAVLGLSDGLRLDLAEAVALPTVKLRYMTEEEYISIFHPLLVEEVIPRSHHCVSLS